MNFSMTQNQTLQHRADMWLPRRTGWGKGWEFGIRRCKPLYTEWIKSKVLLHSTGNYIQCPMINHKGKECEKSIDTHTHTDVYINTYVCVSQFLSHVQLFVTPQPAAHQAPPSMGFSWQEYWSRLPFPPPGDHPHPGIKPVSLHGRRISMILNIQKKERVFSLITWVLD